MRVPEGATRDFTAGCIVLDDGHQVLLMRHSELGMWLQPGGHIENGEVPSEAALRETREETGWKVEIVDDFVPNTEYDGRTEDVPTPFRMNLHRIEDGHYHLESLFLTRPVERGRAPGSSEHDGLDWFSRSELASVEVPENLVGAVDRAVELTQ